MKVKVVKFEWVDSCSMHGWNAKSHFADFAKSSDYKCLSVGMLVYETEDYIVLLQTVGDNQCSETMKIPKSAIKSLMEIASEIEIDLEI